MSISLFQTKLMFLSVVLFVLVNSQRPLLIQTTQVRAYNLLHQTFGIQKILLLAPQDCVQCLTLKHDIYRFVNEMNLAKRVNIYAATTSPGSRLQIRSYDSNGIIKMLLSGTESLYDLQYFLQQSLGKNNAQLQEKLQKGFSVKKLTNEDKLIREYDQKIAEKRISKMQTQRVKKQISQLKEKKEEKDNTIQNVQKIYTKIKPEQNQPSISKQEPLLKKFATTVTSQAINSLTNTLNNINTQNLKKEAIQIQNRTKQVAATLSTNKTAYYALIGFFMIAIGWLICKITKKQDHFISIPNSQHFQMNEKIQCSHI